jgi:hypothetical protein
VARRPERTSVTPRPIPGSNSRRICALPGRRICAEQSVRRDGSCDGGRICDWRRDSRWTGRGRRRMRRNGGSATKRADSGCAGRRRGGRRMRRDGGSPTKRRPAGRDGGREKGPAAATAGGSGRAATTAGEEEGAGRKRKGSTATAPKNWIRVGFRRKP